MAENVATEPMVLTSDGRERLQRRLEEATEAMREIAERLGQRSDVDHADYGDYLRLVDQVTTLRRVLDSARDPRSVPDDPSIIEVGDEVVIEFDDGETERYVLVHPIEAGIDDTRVSVASPLGSALLGRRVGERITVDAPAGAYECIPRHRARAS